MPTIAWSSDGPLRMLRTSPSSTPKTLKDGGWSAAAKTFRERLADFPVKIEVLSRFRTTKEQKAVVARLATGDVDIVIGTHRLLSRDVKFHALGLVVIDEEHRFGVAQKERLRQMTRTVDVRTEEGVGRTSFAIAAGDEEDALTILEALQGRGVPDVKSVRIEED